MTNAAVVKSPDHPSVEDDLTISTKIDHLLFSLESIIFSSKIINVPTLSSSFFVLHLLICLLLTFFYIYI